MRIWQVTPGEQQRWQRSRMLCCFLSGSSILSKALKTSPLYVFIHQTFNKRNANAIMQVSAEMLRNAKKDIKHFFIYAFRIIMLRAKLLNLKITVSTKKAYVSESAPEFLTLIFQLQISSKKHIL